MKFGTLQGVLGEPLSDVFAVAKELGFDGVELDWRERSQAQSGGPLGPEQRPVIREAADAAGVEISSVAAHFLNQGGIASADNQMQQQGLEAVREGIDLCRDLGVRVLLVPFFGPGTIEDEAGIERLTASLKQLAPDAEAAGVILGIEHTLRGDQAASLLAAVGSPCVGDYWDMANCMCFGYDPLQEIEYLKDHLAQVHAK
ncbi:MAG: sugar phosphate isomerase/epimerase, partial [Armatimonadota bacterium]|nr:sugar phosphate isomerase/epimerase [Armatimonadota bacterium]